MIIRIHEAVDLLTDELAPRGGEVRAVKDKVRKRIVYALVKGHLRHATPGKEGIDRNALLVWATRKWPGRIKVPVNHFVEVHETVNLGDRAGADTYPASIDACHELLRAARKILVGQDVRIAMLVGELARLRPLAEKYEAIRQANRESARKPRSGDT
jgi:hypothetical protein